MGDYKYLYDNELDFFLAVDSSESGGNLYRKVKKYKDETEFNPSSHISKSKPPQKQKTAKIQKKKANKSSSHIIQYKKLQQSKPIVKTSKNPNYININNIKSNKTNNDDAENTVNTNDLLLGE